ncbi:MAG TPA: hypothetical protein VMB80_14040 [Candidatus Acidoferrum sp.]|nr:hypothetical protein [Candidatus Acidoferrum sp.]
MFADVIFPRVLGVYFESALFLPFAFMVLAIEFAVYIYFQRHLRSYTRLFFIVLGVNIYSWLIGIFLAALIPDRLVPQLPGAKDLLSFAWACFLSTVIEYLALVGFRKRFELRNLGLCVVVANLAGYIFLWVAVSMT